MSLIALLVTLPLAGALCAWLVPSNRARPWLLAPVGLAHLGLSLAAWRLPATASPGGWIMLDAVGKLFLLVISVLFTACALYAGTYLNYRQERNNRVFCLGLLVCLAAMSLAAVAQHLGLLWLAIETTTLTMAPLVYFNRNARSIEATWKYMLICSVGIALALFGIFFLAYATVVGGLEPTLLLSGLRQQAPRLPGIWLQVGFVFMLVGYGTKMGLAPLHTWKPDAYGEAPGVVGAMLAGGLANCGLLGLLRIYQICVATGTPHFYQACLLGTGLFSVAIAAIFLAHQTDFKRMLAYSSVEHMGIFAVALGLGGKALYGALLHLIGNGLAKGVLFLSAGNIHRAFASKNRELARGALRRAPWTGAIFLAGFCAMTASPPFLLFSSEYRILQAAFTSGNRAAGGLLIVCLAVAFLGMAMTVLQVVLGDPPKNRERTRYSDTPLLVGPPLALLVLVGLLGVWLPQPLSELLGEAARLLGGAP